MAPDNLDSPGSKTIFAAAGPRGRTVDWSTSSRSSAERYACCSRSRDALEGLRVGNDGGRKRGCDARESHRTPV